MKRPGRSIVLAGLALAFAAGRAPAAASPPSGGTIAIEPRTADGHYDGALQTFADGVAATLTDRGFTVLPDTGHAAYVAEILLTRDEVGTGRAKVAGDRPAIVGMGAFIPLPTGKSELVPLRRIRLEIRLHRRGDAAILWDGAAVTVRAGGTGKGSDGNVAADLSRAILSAYPDAPEGVIGVP